MYQKICSLYRKHYKQNTRVYRNQMGTYFGEDDIIRLEDIYGRV